MNLVSDLIENLKVTFIIDDWNSETVVFQPTTYVSTNHKINLKNYVENYVYVEEPPSEIKSDEETMKTVW